MPQICTYADWQRSFDALSKPYQSALTIFFFAILIVKFAYGASGMARFKLIPLILAVVCLGWSMLVVASDSPALTTRPDTGEQPLDVSVRIFVADIDSIDASKQSFAAKIFVIASWYDPRLKHNTKGKITRPLSQVWHPRLQIVNAQRHWKSLPEELSILPDGKVYYVQGIWGDFSQPLVLYRFPFDRQIIAFQIVPVGYDNTEVNLIVAKDSKSGLADQFSLPDWKVLAWQIKAMPYIPLSWC